eukprot:Opistho-2@21885
MPAKRKAADDSEEDFDASDAQRADEDEPKPKKRAKKDGGPAMTEEEARAAETMRKECDRLKDKAWQLRVLGRRKFEAAARSVRPPKDLHKCSGGDIVKRGAARKEKYLFAMPGMFRPTAAGPLGTLARLNTPNPAMYIDFPEGRLVLLGTLVHPKNRLLVFQCKSSEVQCDEAYDKLVVFSEYKWIGTAADNPTEAPLPLPDSIAKTIEGSLSQVLPDLPPTQEISGDDVSEHDDDGSGADDDGGASHPASAKTTRPRRAAAVKATYVEKEELSVDESDSDNEENESKPKRAPAKLKRIIAKTSTPSTVARSSAVEDERVAPSQVSHASQASSQEGPTNNNASARKKRVATVKTTAKKVIQIDLETDDDDAEALDNALLVEEKAAPRSRPSAASKAKASAKTERAPDTFDSGFGSMHVPVRSERGATPSPAESDDELLKPSLFKWSPVVKKTPTGEEAARTPRAAQTGPRSASLKLFPANSGY